MRRLFCTCFSGQRKNMAHRLARCPVSHAVTSSPAALGEFKDGVMAFALAQDLGGHLNGPISGRSFCDRAMSARGQVTRYPGLERLHDLITSRSWAATLLHVVTQGVWTFVFKHWIWVFFVSNYWRPPSWNQERPHQLHWVYLSSGNESDVHFFRTPGKSLFPRFLKMSLRTIVRGILWRAWVCGKCGCGNSSAR